MCPNRMTEHLRQANGNGPKPTHDPENNRVRLSKGKSLKDFWSDFILCEYQTASMSTSWKSSRCRTFALSGTATSGKSKC